MKRGKNTGEKSHRVFPVKTPNLQPEVKKEFVKAAESVYLLSFYLTLGIASLPSLFSSCFQSHSEIKQIATNLLHCYEKCHPRMPLSSLGNMGGTALTGFGSK